MAKKLSEAKERALEHMLATNKASSRVACSSHHLFNALPDDNFDYEASEKRLEKHEHHRRGTIAINSSKAKKLRDMI